MSFTRFKLVAVVCLAGGCAGCTSQDDEAPADVPPRVGFDVWTKFDSPEQRLAALLQPRNVPAEISVPMLSDDAEQIAAKLNQTAQIAPATFLRAVRDASVDGIPAYDARLGISQEEYDRLMLGSHIRLKKTGDAAINIFSEGQSLFVVRGLPGLREVKIEPALQMVTTPYGEVARAEEFAVSSVPQLTGPLVGYRWTQPPTAGDIRRYRISDLTLAQSTVDGAVWFIATIVDTVDNQRPVDYYARFAGPQE